MPERHCDTCKGTNILGHTSNQVNEEQSAKNICFWFIRTAGKIEGATRVDLLGGTP